MLGKKDRVLLLGDKGSIGRRYASILTYLKIPWVGRDSNTSKLMIDPLDTEYEKAIVAVPTDMHYKYCKALLEMGIPFLCEKPLSKDPEECEDLLRRDKEWIGHVVCNYQYVFKGTKPVSYNYYKTGKDGLYWDCAQLIYLNKGVVIETKSPCLEVVSLNKVISYEEIERSYVSMVSDWYKGKTETMWDLEDGWMMTEAVLQRMVLDKA